MRIGGQENPLLNVEMVNDISSCNVIIDATANSQTFLALAAIAKRKHIPMVWGEIFGGGGGALMARSLPSLDPTPLEIRNHIYGVFEELEPIPEGKANNYTVESIEQTYIASDADVSSLAASMTQFILDALCTPETPSSYPYSAYLIGFRKYWIFQCPFDTRPIDCSNALRSDSITDLEAQDNSNKDELTISQVDTTNG